MEEEAAARAWKLGLHKLLVFSCNDKEDMCLVFSRENIP